MQWNNNPMNVQRKSSSFPSVQGLSSVDTVGISEVSKIRTVVQRGSNDLRLHPLSQGSTALAK